MINTYKLYLMKLYFRYLMTISIVFVCLIFVLNIIEEIKFFDDLNLSFLYPVIFTLLNLPTILFEISPFIFLITTQMFFLELYNRDEIIILNSMELKFRYNKVYIIHLINRRNIISLVSTLSSNLKKII